MIENTNIEQIINRCHTTWVRNLGAAETYDRGREPMEHLKQIIYLRQM